MRSELDPVCLDFPNSRQAENLESPAVSQDRRGPIDERMQSSRGADDLHPRSNVQMICVPQNDLRSHLTQLPRVDCFNASLGSNGHEYRSVHYSMRRAQTPNTRF